MLGITMTRPQILVLHWVRSHILLVALIVCGLVIVAKTFNTPSTNQILKTPDRAVQQARLFASQLVIGDVEWLIHRADQAAIEKLRNFPPPSFRDISQTQVYETRFLPFGHWLLAPVTAEFSPPESRMQLVKLERRESFFVMTFAALSESYLASYIEAEGRPLVVAVAVRYIEEPRENPFARWLTRLANVDLFPEFIREAASGDWYLIDYRYSFNLREYYEWVRTNEQRLYAQAEQEEQEALSKQKSSGWLSDLKNRAYEESGALHLWSYSECERQLEQVMQQLSQETRAGLDS